MTAQKLTDAEMDALFESAYKPPEPSWLQKSKRRQEAARASVEAEDLLRVPSGIEQAAAVGMGAAESASLGLAPQARGLAAAIPQAAKVVALGGAAPFVMDKPLGGIVDAYRKARDEQREAHEAFSEGQMAAPYSEGRLGVDVLSALSGVVGPAASAGKAGIEIAKGAPASSVLSTGLPKAGDVMGKVKAALGKAIEPLGRRADEKRALTVLGGKSTIMPPALLDEIERIPGGVEEFAGRLRSTEISKGVTTLGGIEKRATQLMERSGQDIGKMIDDADVGGGYIDVPSLVKRLRSEAASIKSTASGVSETQKGRVAQLEAYADGFDELIANARPPTVPGLTPSQVEIVQAHIANGNDATAIANAMKIPQSVIESVPPPGTIPVSEMKGFSMQIGKDAASAYKAEARGMPVPGKGEAMMDTRRAAEDAVGEGIKRAGMDIGPYNEAKRINQVSRIASGVSGKSLGRADVNNPVSLLDVGLAQVNAPIAAIRFALKPFGSSIRATFAETARDWAKVLQNPAAVQALGPQGPAIKAAAEQGPEALKAALAGMAMYGGELQAPPDQSLMGQLDSRLKHR